MDINNEFNQIDFILTSADLLSNPSTTTTTTVALSSTLPEKPTSSSSGNEITSFLSHLGNDIYRQNILEKLLERRKVKEDEMKLRQDEIQIIDDIIQFVNQYPTTHSNDRLISHSQDMLHPTSDLVLLDNSINNIVENLSSEFIPGNDLTIDPLFSPLLSTPTTTYDHPSPLILFPNLITNNDLLDDIHSSTLTNYSMNDPLFSPHPFF